MSTDSHSTRPQSSSQGGGQSADDALWERVAVLVDQFAQAWETHIEVGDEQPGLQDYLPPEGEFRVLALPELVKTDLEYRWQHDRAPRKLEDYAQQFPLRGADGRLPMELIHEELQVRMQAGHRVTQEEIHKRFPQQAAALCEIVGGMAVSGTPTSTFFLETEDMTKMATMPAPNELEAIRFSPGQQVDDFQLLTMLGEGAFAQVFLARQVSMERLVALKISSHRGSEPQTLAQLDHANVVRVFDQRQTLNPPLRLLYMEVVPGGTLQSVVSLVRKTSPGARSGKLLLAVVDERLAANGSAQPDGSHNRNWLATASWPMTVCQVGAQLADGLAYAHAKGVMHRDIKPANVLLTPSGTPKLADFNVSYNGGRADEDPADTFGGSLVYMSPEQLKACHPVLGGSPQRVREASDVYSLGVMLWELLTGNRPFDDETREETSLTKVQRMIDRRDYVDFHELEKQLPSDCPVSLKQVLVKCLQPRPQERYRSAEEVARELRLCLHPQTWKMMQPVTNPLSQLVLVAPLLTAVVASIVPNLLILGFKLFYYRKWMEKFFPALTSKFDVVLLWVNLAAFSIGLGYGLYRAVQVFKFVQIKGLERSNEAERQVLFFGRFVSLLTLTLWTAAGVVYPVALNLDFAVPDVGKLYGHFFATLAICGFAAMAYPYFLLTIVAVRWFVPAMIRNNMALGPSWSDLQRLRTWNRIHLAVAGLVPMLAIILVTVSGSLNADPGDPGANNLFWTLIVVSVGGLVGFAAMFGLERMIDSDISALEHVSVDRPGEQ